MMTCRETIEFLRAYLDGELPERERVEFERHMDACPPCVGYLATYRTTIELARDACRDDDVPPPPEALVEAILRARRRR